MEIDKNLMKKLRAEIDEALSSVGERNGVHLHAGNGSYRGGSGHFKLEISLVEQSGEVITPEAQAFRDRCGIYGFEESDLFAEFTDTMYRRSFKLLGLRPRARTNVMLVEDLANGKKYRMDADVVLRGLRKAA